MTRRILQVILGVLLGLVTVLVLLPVLTRETPPDDPHLLPAPYPAPTSHLTDHTGTERELPGDFAGITVVFFGYTHCPDVCPLTMANLAVVRDSLAPERKERFRVLLVSVDPARDTPERLARYVARFDTTFVGLTGTEAEIRETTAAWGAWAERATTAPTATDEPPGSADTAAGVGAAGAAEAGATPGAADTVPEEYVVDHTARSFVVDARGTIVATFPASTPADAMLPTVRYLLEEGGW